MVLAKNELLDYVSSGGLSFSPGLDGFQVQPHAVDLRLGFTFRLPKMWELNKEGRVAVAQDPTADRSDAFEEIELTPGQYFDILPKEFVLGTTLEEIGIETGKLMGVLYPRSSVNRRGLAINMSGIIDAGYKGRLIIPLMNNTESQVIRVYPGERVCQVVFMELSSELSKAQAQQHGLTRAKYHAKEEVASRGDRKDENALIRSGRLEQLKKTFAVATN
ncbi:MAG: dCTP deaminase [Candidatus Doudnabacteria bacterium]|nr:dCTP deaminase [Candidatus Doudnabacteria bacterium]